MLKILPLKVTGVKKDLVLSHVTREFSHLEQQVQVLKSRVEATVDAEVVYQDDDRRVQALLDSISYLQETVKDLKQQLLEAHHIDPEDILENLITGYASVDPRLAYAKAQQAFNRYTLTEFYDEDSRTVIARGLYQYFLGLGFQNNFWYSVFKGSYAPTPIQELVATTKLG